MLVWFVLFGAVFLPRIVSGSADVSVEMENPLALKCLRFTKSTTETQKFESTIKNETCGSGEGCEYAMRDPDALYNETGYCVKLDEFQKGSMFLRYGEKSPFVYSFVCNTDFCNSKKGPYYKKLQEILNLAKKTVENLDQEAEKQGNAALSCYNKKGSSTICSEKTCHLGHNVSPDGNVVRDTGCGERGNEKPSVAMIHMRATFGADKTTIDIKSKCFYNNCNGEGSILDKFNDEIRNILSKGVLPTIPSMSPSLLAPFLSILMAIIYI